MLSVTKCVLGSCFVCWSQMEAESLPKVGWVVRLHHWAGVFVKPRVQGQLQEEVLLQPSVSPGGRVLSRVTMLDASGPKGSLSWGCVVVK